MVGCDGLTCFVLLLDFAAFILKIRMALSLIIQSFQGMKLGNYKRSKYILDSPTYLVEIV
jgi:hypothetical protein